MIVSLGGHSIFLEVMFCPLCQFQVCRALTRAINPDTPSPNCIVPRMLFLEGLFGTGKFPQEWKAPFGSRMSVLGCAMLQTAFNYPQVHIPSFSSKVLVFIVVLMVCFFVVFGFWKCNEIFRIWWLYCFGCLLVILLAAGVMLHLPVYSSTTPYIFL